MRLAWPGAIAAAAIALSFWRPVSPEIHVQVPRELKVSLELRPAGPVEVKVTGIPEELQLRPGTVSLEVKGAP
jgi:hypothetical protein